MLRRGGLAYRQGKGGPKTVEDHCGKAGRSKVNRLLAKQTRLFSYIEGLQAETRVYYTLWQCGPELRILVSGEAGVPRPEPVAILIRKRRNAQPGRRCAG